MSSPNELPSASEITALSQAALACLPISWNGLVIEAQPQQHNPDFFDDVVELLGSGDRAHLERQDRAAARGSAWTLPAASAPEARVLSGKAFEREYGRPNHRTMFVMMPLLSRDLRSGLVVVQLEEVSRGGGMVTDHWVFMQREPGGDWCRRPVPAHLKERLFLTAETAG